MRLLIPQHRSSATGRRLRPQGLFRSPTKMLWGFADLAQPVCRVKDEPRPSCAIVHACSRVASRNGAAGYKLMRSSHATWTSTLSPPTTSIPRQTEKTTTSIALLSRQHSAVLDQSRTSPLGGAIAPSLTDLARRAPQTPGSERKNGLFRSNKRMDESQKGPIIPN